MAEFAKRDNPGARIGAENRERVREFLQAHLGATNREVALALDLSALAVGRHVRAIRSEWAGEEGAR